jgi:salicylate hydroxylase
MARGRVALLGDAAHPMRPFLAQGAAMALEDAAALGQVLKDLPNPQRDLPAALTQYAQQRWQRAARVQARSRRNGQIYHLDGPLRLGRDLALQALGARLMDLPWLYGHRAA